MMGKLPLFFISSVIRRGHHPLPRANEICMYSTLEAAGTEEGENKSHFWYGYYYYYSALGSILCARK